MCGRKAVAPPKLYSLTQEGKNFSPRTGALVDAIFSPDGRGEPDHRRRSGAGNPPRDGEFGDGVVDPARQRPA